MLFDELYEIEDRIEEVDYPPSEVESYESSSDDEDEVEEEEEDEDEEEKDKDEDCEMDEDGSTEEDEDTDEEEEKDVELERAARAATSAAAAGIKPFAGEQRLLVKIAATPAAYFLHLVDDTFLATICENTNREAARAGEALGEQFAPLHLAELKVFLGIALHAKHGVGDLFRGERFFTPRFYRLFPKSMTEERFLEILRRLHFSPQPLDLTTFAALGNVVEHFNSKMENTYSPGRELCIYNSVVIWRGGVVCRERVARHFDDKHGVAVDALREPAGVTLRLRASPQALQLERAGAALGARVVDGLLRGLLDRGHALYLDPFYCSMSLARRLLARDTYCTGVVARRRARAPSVDGVAVGQCSLLDRRFSYLTTEFGERTVPAPARSGRKAPDPAAVVAYMHATRRGEDREQELLASPGASFRLQWHKQVFLLALDAMARNAWVLYRRYSGDSMSLMKFLCEVTVALLPVGIDDLSDEEEDDGDESDADSSRCV